MNFHATFLFALSLIILESIIGDIITKHFRVVTDSAFEPNRTDSIVQAIQFSSASRRTVIDCAQTCMKRVICRTAVFEQQQLVCSLYSESAISSGRLIVNSTGVFTTIVPDQALGKVKSLHTDQSSDNFVFLLISRLVELVQIPSTINASAVWNTTAGQDSVPATPGWVSGNYWYEHSPNNVFDGNWSTPFCSYGEGNSASNTYVGGINTGVYLTLPGGPIVLEGFRFISFASNPSQFDPKSVTIEGSNQLGAALTLGSSWTLIYNGTTGLDPRPPNQQEGVKQSLPKNELAFSSYRFLMTQNRSPTTCITYTDLELYKL